MYALTQVLDCNELSMDMHVIHVHVPTLHIHDFVTSMYMIRWYAVSCISYVAYAHPQAVLCTVPVNKKFTSDDRPMIVRWCERHRFVPQQRC